MGFSSYKQVHDSDMPFKSMHVKQWCLFLRSASVMADRLQELLEAQVLLKSLYFYGVFFLCPMRGYRPSGRMYNLFFFMAVPLLLMFVLDLLHLHKTNQRALECNQGLTSWIHLSCLLSSSHIRQWAHSQCTQWVLEKGLKEAKVSLVWIQTWIWPDLNLRTVTDLTFGFPV